MNIDIIENPDPQIITFFDQKIEEFNVVRWEVKSKKPLAVKIENENGEIIAGAAAKTFGLWLLIDNIWVDESLRGQNIGSKILMSLERAAVERGCKYALLDTLDFQARPFYEKYGYKLQWTQNNYPIKGCKYFMVKDF